ncbi:hypothetical protein BH11ACT4_BH11ACT4_10890 [soil metagenome]
MRPTTEKLLQSSIDVILAGQSPSGAYVASPNFPSYRFAWLRDGAFCAMAMDAAGQRDSARRFHDWVAAVIERHADAVVDIIARLTAGDQVDQLRMMPTRYTLDGILESEQDEVWPNFQLDGYGTWLFALEAHYSGAVPEALLTAVATVADYLVSAWEVACFDYWEEFGDRRHTSTLASLAAGLEAAGRILPGRGYDACSALVAETVMSWATTPAGFTKGPTDARVDASLLSLSTPFGLVAPDDPRMVATVRRIETDLRSPSGGIRRYQGDTFYGGNPWLMLTAWYGWHQAMAGDREAAEYARDWVEARADAEGMLAEQVLDEPQSPAFVEIWTEKWGPVADPLLWSHAQYILLINELSTLKGHP